MALQTTSVEETYQQLKEKLIPIAQLSDSELRYKAELIFEINTLKKKRNAIILGHNYMEPALYVGVADVVGDSLELSRKAAETLCDPIIFCGVRFMAETAKILNPTRTVLLPAEIAGCSLAGSITAADVRKLKEQYPGIPVTTYVNSYADVKAETDVCITSGNAVKIINALESDTVICIPDEYLAKNIAKETGKNIITWHGKCEVHEQFMPSDVAAVRRAHPDAEILAHPECSPDVVAVSDFAGSTSKMLSHIRNSPRKKFMLFTECAMADNVATENPDKEMVRMCSIRCPHMHEITLEDTLRALKDNYQEITVPEEIRVRAKKSLDRMLEMSV